MRLRLLDYQRNRALWKEAGSVKIDDLMQARRMVIMLYRENLDLRLAGRVFMLASFSGFAAVIGLSLALWFT